MGIYPDAKAARQALTAVSKYLSLKVDFSKLDASVEHVKKTLEAFGLMRNLAEEKKKEEQQLRWFI